MREVVLRSVGAVSITLVGLLGIAAFLHILVTLPFPENKGAEWVGAIGTIGTLIGTIWLATDAQRRVRQSQIDLATIAAAHFVRAVPKAIDLIESARDVLVDDADQDQDQGYLYHALAQSFEEIPTWSSANLASIVVLPNRAAAKLAIAKVEIERIAEYLHDGSEKCRMRQAFNRADFEYEVFATIRVILGYLDEGCDACLAILDSEPNRAGPPLAARPSRASR